jgi:hypothetical protein
LVLANPELRVAALRALVRRGCGTECIVMRALEGNDLAVEIKAGEKRYDH